MKRALIEGERVCEVRDRDFPVASPLRWVDCDDAVTTLHRYVDGGFVAPVLSTPPTDDDLFEMQKWLKALALACSNQTIAGIAWSTSGYTPAQIKARAVAAYKALV